MVEPKTFHPISLTWLHLLLLPQHGTKAQSSTQPLPLFATQKMWGPSMAVVIGALIGIFLLVAVLLLYLRRCTESYFTPHRSNHHPCSCGIHPELLHTFPTLFFSTIKHLLIGKGTLECAVCLTEFTDSDTLRLLPQCNHVFHPPCIDQWLSSHITCPVCRADLNQDFNQVPILVPTQLNVEGSGSRAEAEQGGGGGGGESEIERCPAREGQRKSDENKGVRNRVSKSKLLRRSNSTGHSVVESGECVERYTLRLPEDVRKYILLNHGVVQRSASYHVVMPVVGSSRKALCWSDSEGSSRRSQRNSVGLSLR